MKHALLCLVLLASVVSASAANPTISITPSPVVLPSGSVQQFTASFSDGSQVQSCAWMTTGSLNAIQSTGAGTATFAAGTLKATYIVQANCRNVNGVPAVCSRSAGKYSRLPLESLIPKKLPLDSNAAAVELEISLVNVGML